ncbi:MAG: CPBP family intramembrane metalloprotease [Candidimonas sp.]|nr:MAG: CPBP family intramembrane metalloprotease [Candidimonas sp.]
MADCRARLTFRAEFRDYLRFFARPRFAPRLRGRAAISGWTGDWFPSVRLGGLVRWAAVLWVVNLFFLGPIALAAATAGGAQSRLNLLNIPWLSALLWAPIVEELVFRYGLRHLAQAIWLFPASLAAMLMGLHWYSALLLAAVLAGCWVPMAVGARFARRPLPWRWRRRYWAVFPWVFHASCLLFAAAHLANFSFDGTPLWLMPLLVLPQWLTGTVLGWQRMRRGVGASMLLHGIFNAGPLAMVWLVVHIVPHWMT